MLTPFHYAFVQRGALELLLLSVGAGVLRTWIVLRGLAFYSHGVATASFPGLVLAAGGGFAAPLGAAAVPLLFAAPLGRLPPGGRAGLETPPPPPPPAGAPPRPLPRAPRFPL